ncbi:hypothetical protein ABT090_20900 [Streptomyces asoensis]|uniref:hypothetical protein n=1 Tax=Streptomyces asoensis TaxID=249586 RepID=UPI00331A5FD5
MGEPQLNIKPARYYGPTCDSGRHTPHGGDTCEEADDFIAALDRYVSELASQALDLSINGSGSLQIRGLLPLLRKVHEPTPTERALDILAPHLRNEPLYRP